MNLIIEAVITGVLSGGVYALMASGLTLTFGVMEIINIAQGAMVILGAYLSYQLQQSFHLDLFLGLLITVPFMFLLGFLLEILLIRPLKRDRTMMSILVTFALALIIEGGLGIVFGTTLVQMHAPYVEATLQVGDYFLPYIYLYGFALSLALLAALYFLLYRTKFGYGLRAAMQDRTAAELIGVNIERTSAVTFGLGMALAAAGGMAYGATTAFNPASHLDLISRLLVIIILAGMGSLPGALVASLAMLVVEDVTSVVWSPIWANTVFFILLVIVLLVRPQGLFGKLQARKQ